VLGIRVDESASLLRTYGEVRRNRVSPQDSRSKSSMTAEGIAMAEMDPPEEFSFLQRIENSTINLVFGFSL